MKRLRINPEPFNYEHIQDRNFSHTRTRAIVHAHSSENSSSLSSENLFPQTTKNFKEKAYRFDQMFQTFWSLYPKKVDKGKALKAWKKMCASEDRPSWSIIEEALLAQKKSERWQNSQYIPHPTTWLNQFRWLDDPKEMVTSTWIEPGKEQKPPKVMEDGMWWFLEKDGSYYNRQGQRLS